MTSNNYDALDFHEARIWRQSEGDLVQFQRQCSAFFLNRIYRNVNCSGFRMTICSQLELRSELAGARVCHSATGLSETIEASQLFDRLSRWRSNSIRSAPVLHFMHSRLISAGGFLRVVESHELAENLPR